MMKHVMLCVALAAVGCDAGARPPADTTATTVTLTAVAFADDCGGAPPHDAPAENEFGIAPHTDTSFMTLLAQNRIPGLSIRLPTGRWVDAPAIDGAFLVNGGDLLRRWTNDRFLATPHRVLNRSGQERYAIPFFFDCAAEFRALPAAP